MRYEQFIRNSGYWNRMNYSEGFPAFIHLNADLEAHTIDCLRELGILNRPMNGNSIVGLPRVDFAENHGVISYSELFHSMTEEDSFFSPAYFAYRIVEMYFNNAEGFDTNIANGYICRGLRTLASMFREMCLEYKIKRRLPEAVINVGVELDINEHTDLLINHSGNVFRIWSYQSNRLYHTIEKIKGNRGSLPLGLFILCPLDVTEYQNIENINDWYMYSDSYVDRVVELILQGEFDNTDRYSNVISGQSDQEIEAYISQIRIMVKED